MSSSNVAIAPEVLLRSLTAKLDGVRLGQKFKNCIFSETVSLSILFTDGLGHHYSLFTFPPKRTLPLFGRGDVPCSFYLRDAPWPRKVENWHVFSMNMWLLPMGIVKLISCDCGSD